MQSIFNQSSKQQFSLIYFSIKQLKSWAVSLEIKSKTLPALYLPPPYIYFLD